MQRKAPWTLILGTCLGLCGGLSGYLAWNNRDLRTELEHQQQTVFSQQSELDEWSQRHESLEQEHTAVTARLEEARITRQSLEDRATNLAAQGDHLRAELQQKSSRLEQLTTHVASLETQLAESRHRVLQLEQLPGELNSRLESARERMAALENQIDEQAALLSELPPVLTFSGVSSDRRVFSLHGKARELSESSKRVYLLNSDGLVLEGWIHKILDGRIIGHAGKWHQPASALVKGEKVLMLPSKSHEMHH